MSLRLLDLDDLRARGIKYSKSQIFRLIRSGRFPKPVQGAGKANAWPESEIDAFIASLISARDDAAA
jgi:prophage regulatory protein